MSMGRSNANTRGKIKKYPIGKVAKYKSGLGCELLGKRVGNREEQRPRHRPETYRSIDTGCYRLYEGLGTGWRSTILQTVAAIIDC